MIANHRLLAKPNQEFTWQPVAAVPYVDSFQKHKHLIGAGSHCQRTLQVQGYAQCDARDYQAAEAGLCSAFAHQIVSPSIVLRELADNAPEVALRHVP